MVDENKSGGEKHVTLTFKKASLWMVGTFFFAILFVLAIVGVIGDINNGSGISGNVIAPTNPSGVVENVKVQINDDDPVLGNADAGVSIVEFSDFQCPFCARAYYDSLYDFKSSDYFLNGEVNLVFKHFPLTSIHPDAQKSAEASECANAQGKFWEYHDTLFENQDALDEDSLKEYAKTVGLNTAEFNSCLDSSEMENSVSEDSQQGLKAGTQGTPYFVVVNNQNGDTYPVSGAVPFSN